MSTHQPTSKDISDTDLEFIEQHLFHEYDEAYAKYTDGYPNQDEVIAYRSALETITKIREVLSEKREIEMKQTIELSEDILEELDVEQPDI